MDSCDVVIVGGGPAGSTCAWQLRQSGLDVVVVDKAGFPRDKVCAGWITPAVIDELQLDLDVYRHGRVLQPITGFRTSVLGGGEVCTSYPRPVSYGIRRCEFDHYLLERSGARLMTGTPVHSLRRDGQRWIINDSIVAPLLVGAGGHFCPVARQTATTCPGAEVVVMAQEIEFELDADQRRQCAVDGCVPELFFCADLKGYAWVFRKGNFLNVGLGREGESRLNSHVEQFCAWLRERERIGWNIEERFRGHAYRLYLGGVRQSQDDRVLLIGDAAGLAYPQSGEGIRPAIESGLMAAETILETPSDRLDRLGNAYRQKLTTWFGRPPSPPGQGTGLAGAWRRFAARKLLATGWFTRRVLIERWFLHTHRPSLKRRVGARATLLTG
ncbi:MAG: NAD(P)/FAD-dependent oxidoreductase [Planctomycetaceae bacterium]